MAVIGIVGSRRRDTREDLLTTQAAFQKVYKTGDTLVSGGCPRGGDRFCEQIAVTYNVPIKIYRANWSLGRHAGFLRNTDIARDADILIAVVSSDRTGGTEDTIRKYTGMGKKDLILV